jgi:hypothetical protein
MGQLGKMKPGTNRIRHGIGPAARSECDAGHTPISDMSELSRHTRHGKESSDMGIERQMTRMTRMTRNPSMNDHTRTRGSSNRFLGQMRHTRHGDVLSLLLWSAT